MKVTDGMIENLGRAIEGYDINEVKEYVVDGSFLIDSVAELIYSAIVDDKKDLMTEEEWSVLISSLLSDTVSIGKHSVILELAGINLDDLFEDEGENDNE